MNDERDKPLWSLAGCVLHAGAIVVPLSAMILLPVFTSMRWWQGIIAGLVVGYVYFGAVESLLKSIALLVAAEGDGRKSWLRRFVMFCVASAYLLLKAACCVGTVAILLANLRWYVGLAAFMAIGIAMWLIEFVPVVFAALILASTKNDAPPPLPRVDGSRNPPGQPAIASSQSSETTVDKEDFDDDLDDDEFDDDFDDDDEIGDDDADVLEPEKPSTAFALGPEDKLSDLEKLAISRLRARAAQSAEEERAQQLAEAVARFQAKLDAIGTKKNSQ